MNTAILSQTQARALWSYYTDPPPGVQIKPQSVVIEPFWGNDNFKGFSEIVKYTVTEGGLMWEAQ